MTNTYCYIFTVIHFGIYIDIHIAFMTPNFKAHHSLILHNKSNIDTSDKHLLLNIYSNKFWHIYRSIYIDISGLFISDKHLLLNIYSNKLSHVDRLFMLLFFFFCVGLCVLVWTNDMFRMQSHDIKQPITVWCKICDGVVGGKVGGMALV